METQTERKDTTYTLSLTFTDKTRICPYLEIPGNRQRYCEGAIYSGNQTGRCYCSPQHYSPTVGIEICPVLDRLNVGEKYRDVFPKSARVVDHSERYASKDNFGRRK